MLYSFEGAFCVRRPWVDLRFPPCPSPNVPTSRVSSLGNAKFLQCRPMLVVGVSYRCYLLGSRYVCYVMWCLFDFVVSCFVVFCYVLCFFIIVMLALGNTAELNVSKYSENALNNKTDTCKCGFRFRNISTQNELQKYLETVQQKMGRQTVFIINYIQYA